jgi:hypothetical protein
MPYGSASIGSGSHESFRANESTPRDSGVLCPVSCDFAQQSRDLMAYAFSCLCLNSPIWA